MKQVSRCNLSIIVVVKNNYAGLVKTIESIESLNSSLIQTVVVDCHSIDGGAEWILNKNIQNLVVISGHDEGIYDAMNKARKFVVGDYVLYLNSGDWLSGVFFEISQPCLLKVNIISKEKVHCDFIKLFGFGYNHQGIIFDATHQPFDSKYFLAADLHLIINTFKSGLKELPIIPGLQANYRLDGVSSHKSIKKNLGVSMVFWDCQKYFLALLSLFYLPIKDLIPYKFKYHYAKFFKYE